MYQIQNFAFSLHNTDLKTLMTIIQSGEELGVVPLMTRVSYTGLRESFSKRWIMIRALTYQSFAQPQDLPHTE